VQAADSDIDSDTDSDTCTRGTGCVGRHSAYMPASTRSSHLSAHAPHALRTFYVRTCYTSTLSLSLPSHPPLLPSSLPPFLFIFLFSLGAVLRAAAAVPEQFPSLPPLSSLSSPSLHPCVAPSLFPSLAPSLFPSLAPSLFSSLASVPPSLFPSAARG
jgi:hypothetical protein